MSLHATIPELCFDREALAAEVERATGRQVQRNNMCFCPFHANVNTPAAHILQADNGVWRVKCFAGCHRDGEASDIFEVRARLSGKNRSDCIREWGEKASPRPLAAPARPVAREERPARRVEDANALKALYGDRFEDWYGYGYDEKNNPRWIVVRHRTPGGKAMGQWTRNADGSFIERGPGKEEPRPLFKLGKVAKADEVVWVEGEKCVKALEKYGFAATTSMGGSNAVQFTDYSPLAGKTVYVWPDKDGERQRHAGQKAGEHVVKEALRNGAKSVRVVDIDALTELPECGDVADFIEEMEKGECTREMIVQALHDVLRLGKKMGSATGVFEYMRRQASGELATLKMAGAMMQQTRALKPGSICMVNGKPGCGKSFWVLHEAIKHHDDGHKVALLMLEGDRNAHSQRALAHKAKDGRICDPDYIEGKQFVVDQARAKWESWMDGFSPRIWDKHDFPDDTVTIPQALEWVEARLKEGTRLLVIDPITIIMPTQKDRYNEDKKFTARVESLLKKYNASLILVTHPKPGVRHVELDNMQLGFAYQGFTMTVLFFESVDGSKGRYVTTGAGGSAMKKLNFNRVVHLLKTRDGKPDGRQLGVNFNGQTMEFEEQGFLSAVAEAEEKRRAKTEVGF